MERILIMDVKNYSLDLEEIYQVVVRGIIFIDGKLLMIEDNFGEIEEKRLSLHEPMIWHQISRLYFCDVYPEKGLCDYTENEKKYGFKQVLYTQDEVLEKNRIMLEKEGKQAWNQHE